MRSWISTKRFAEARKLLIYLRIFKIRTPTDHISQLKKINNGGRIHEIIGGCFICGYPDCSRGVDWSGEGWNGQTVTQSLADSRYLARKWPVAQAGVSGLNFIPRNPTAHEGHKRATASVANLHQVAEIAAIYEGLDSLRNRFLLQDIRN